LAAISSSSTTSFNENLRGIVAMVLCNTLFLINDAQLKLLSVDMPIGQLIFMRGLFSTVIIGAIVLWTGQYRAVGQLRHPAIGLRLVGEIAAAFLFLYALFHMPIANINAILQVVPLMITAAGAVFFAEHVGWRRWTAIAVGFIGVLVIVRPGLEGFNEFSLVALGAMLFVTLKDLTTRMLPRELPAMLVGLITAIAVGLSGAVYGLTEDWVVPQWHHLALLTGSALFLIAGYYTSVIAMRHGDISITAPFRYTVVISAIIVGYILWRDVPDVPMLIGTAIIIATGVYTFRREARLAIARGRSSQ
jgi:drug/metabolite transporter (DMT)-like permease